MNLHFTVSVQLSRQNVMVAFYQNKFDLRMGSHPFFKQLPFAVYIRMKKISYKNDLPDILLPDGLIQSLQVVKMNVAWHGYACFPKMAGFSKVEVRQDQSLMRVPVQTFFR